MPNDAKLALVIGVGLVVAVAVLFYHGDFLPGRTDDRSPASVGNPPAGPTTGSGTSTPRRGMARPTGLVKADESAADEGVERDGPPVPPSP